MRDRTPISEAIRVLSLYGDRKFMGERAEGGSYDDDD